MVHKVPWWKRIFRRKRKVVAITAARASLQEAKFQLREVQVSLGPDPKSATAQLMTLAYLNGSGDPLVQELKMQLKKIDRRWKICRVETVKSLGL